MSSKARGYQLKAQASVIQAWQEGIQNVMLVMGTGTGKTFTSMSMVPRLPGRGVVQAHRAELIGQLSMSLAEQGVRHNIVGNAKTRRAIVDEQIDKLGRSYFDPSAPWRVESVDTAIRRKSEQSADYMVIDEAHHVVVGNKWHRGTEQHPDARRLLLTASPYRADGKGLGIHASGIVQRMVVGPGIGQAMAEGYLVEYDIKSPTASDLNMSDVSIGPGGEYVQDQATRAVKRSKKIIGDAVANYREFAWGRRTLVFTVDIEHANDLLAAYRAAGIPAEVVTGEDMNDVRRNVLRSFILRDIWVVINVDLFGEGTDIPGVEVVQMCRPTASFSIFAQQLGRMMRLAIARELMALWDTFSIATRKAYIAASEKPRGLLIDHVGNIHTEYKIGEFVYRGPPEGFSQWDAGLDDRARRSSGPSETIPQRTCLKCGKAYERFYDACPYCKAEPPAPEVKPGVKHADGNLYDYDPNYLAELRAEIARIAGAPQIPSRLEGVARMGAQNKWLERQAAQTQLRESIARWAGKNRHRSDTENYRYFYHRFGVDVVNALALSTRDAQKLKEQVDAEI